MLGRNWTGLLVMGALACSNSAKHVESNEAAWDSVLGLAHDGDCDTAADFNAQCREEGGTLADGCVWSSSYCGDAGMTCYPPPPIPPGQGEFTCDELFNCSTGHVCAILAPVADGCTSHACPVVPSACADEPSCACIQKVLEEVRSCTEDANGNLTVTVGYWPADL